MSVDISGYGTTVNMVVIPLFPTGINLSHFTGSSNPVEFPEIEVAGREMGVNGDLQYWIKPAPIDVVFSVIPGSEDDQNLKLLLQATRAIRGKPIIPIVIPACTITYPSGRTITLSNGTLLKAPPDNTVESDGKLSPNKYTFSFEYNF